MPSTRDTSTTAQINQESALWIDGMYPLGTAKAVTPATQVVNSGPRIWYSNARYSTDRRTEVLTIKFRKAVTINGISFGLRTLPQKYEVWATLSTGALIYLNTSALNYSGGSIRSGSSLDTPTKDANWTKITRELRPTTVSKIHIRVQRLGLANPTVPFPIGVRDVLVRRTVRQQQDTIQPLATEIDRFGNTIRHQVQEWSPSKAADSDAYTFWRSGPQASPNAVVNFYATIGDGRNPRRVDRFFMDPVYTGNTMNVYYSMDDVVSSFLPKADNTVASVTNKANLIEGVGLRLSGAETLTINTGKLFSLTGAKDSDGNSGSLDSNPPYPVTGWFGMEWRIAPTTNLTGTKTLFRTNYPDGTDSNHPPFKLTYSAGVFTLQSGLSTHSVNSGVISISPSSEDRVQIVGAVVPDEAVGYYRLRLLVKTGDNLLYGQPNSTVWSDTLSNPFPLTSGTGMAKFYYPGATTTFTGNLGYIQSFIVKADEQEVEEYLSYLANPSSYVDVDSWFTDEELADEPQAFNQSNLEWATYVGDFLSGTTGYGGVGQEAYTNKIWTPVWKDWKTQRGFFYLPYPVTAKHLKFEFSKLSEQPYPIFETDIQTSYQVFPLIAQYPTTKPIQQKITAAPANGTIQRPNYLTASSVTPNNAAKTNVYVSSQLVEDLRNQDRYSSDLLQDERALTSALRSAVINDNFDIAAGVVKSLTADNSPSGSLAPSANDPVLVNALAKTELNGLGSASTSGSLGTRVPGWWILPGGRSQIPSEVMEAMTATSTTTERSVADTDLQGARTRFQTSSIHRYDKITVTRDVGLAYFAGLRELQLFKVDYTVPSDSPSYQVLSYDSTVIASSSNMVLGTNELPAHPVTDSANASMIINSWPSVSTFVKVGLTTIDRGIHSWVKGFDTSPFRPDDGVPRVDWTDGRAKWANPVDTTDFWGANSQSADFDFDSNITFSGRTTTKISRSGGSGVAGIQTQVFGLLNKSKVRLRADLYRPTSTTNTIKAQLVNTSPITTVIKEFVVSTGTGSWTQWTSDWFSLTQSYQNLRIRFVIDGADEEVIYVADLYDEATTIFYSLSNDDGVTYYEVTEIADLEDAFFVFPKPGNRLKAKIEMFDPLDYAFGLTVTPTYLF